jgi:phenylacetyl-CoA:acceptor oxidoreductase subunit 2
MILYGAKGIPAWREPRIISLIIATGLTEGGGLCLALMPFADVSRAMAQATAIIVVLLATARHWFWHVYVHSLNTKGAPRRTLEVLRSTQTRMSVFGLALPCVCILAGFIPGIGTTFAFALGGLSAAAAGWLLKFRLVTRAGYNQGFALSHIPARGSGAVARAIQPGWARAATIAKHNKTEVAP